MTIKKEKEGEVLVVSIEGTLDINTAPQLTDALEGELNDVNEVHFDLAKTDYTSSAGLRVFLRTFQILDKKDGRMVIENVNETFYDILKLSGFTDFLEITKA
ncbi:STAS domain-containing protein [Butyrivibrio sp. AE2032]|jgi:anti-sigma B factor antagonist|uniref:STAS domain-containing protein n=1 Tax=Butyrivibrio sp. AE2032 TaxID=1458463 RepID=UPI000553AC8A|nr:STAS domain-containing protein [Butyrivibrio sp. AE2032]